eukprot:15362221-Ditylum_brightwellii.AAC.1
MKHTEACNLMYTRMKRCLKSDDKSKITQIEVPEWDKLEFVILMGLCTISSKVAPQLQWWFILYFYTIGQAFTN